MSYFWNERNQICKQECREKRQKWNGVIAWFFTTEEEEMRSFRERLSGLCREKVRKSKIVRIKRTQRDLK